MSLWQFLRRSVALVAAYAVALQTILLVFGGPIAGAAELAVPPLCLHLAVGGDGSPPVPAGRACLAACLTGCCYGAVTLPTPHILVAAPKPKRTVAAAVVVSQVVRVGGSGAHRSRAPPLG